MMNDKLLALLARELGDILSWEEKCPGVFYLNSRPRNNRAQEYYLVLETAPISCDVRKLGRRLEYVPAWIYLLNTEDGAWAAVEYEVLRFQVQNGTPLSEEQSLWEVALYGMELCPDYFGLYPVPSVTPWGHTLRHKTLSNGVYWIETDRVKQGLAVCWPLWPADLSDAVLQMGYSETDHLENIFFPKEMSCLALFELSETRPAWFESGLIRRTELMNAIWTICPAYAAEYNSMEQAGLHDILGVTMKALGCDVELKNSTKHMITMTPGAGTDFLGFWH